MATLEARIAALENSANSPAAAMQREMARFDRLPPEEQQRHGELYGRLIHEHAAPLAEAACIFIAAHPGLLSDDWRAAPEIEDYLRHVPPHWQDQLSLANCRRQLMEGCDAGALAQKYGWPSLADVPRKPEAVGERVLRFHGVPGWDIERCASALPYVVLKG